MKFKLVFLVSIAFLTGKVFAEVDGASLYKQCILCHGAKGEGNPAQKAPRLSGQADWYILKQLEDMKAGVNRKNPVMVPFLNKLSSDDMKALSKYIQGLK